MVMTEQYLSGELSVLLAQLREVATQPRRAQQVERLRQEAETVPIAVLGWVTTRALSLTNALCWDSIGRGDMTGFRRQAEVSAQLYEFGVCAGLLTER
jgi:hypothetical protein